MASLMPEPQVVEVETADGVTLRCRRYPRPGARAVLCAHGLASTGYEFDLPLPGFRLSEVLYRLGYEVWIMNFRGAGHPPWRSEAGDWSHSGDQLGAFDLPAVIERVRKETGFAPFYFGHSFGGMALYMYLSGVVMDEDDPTSVRLDPEVARERNSGVAGALTAGSPVVIPEAKVDWMERLRRNRWTQRAFLRVERYLLRRYERGSARRIPIGDMSRRIGFRRPWLARIIMSSPFMKMYMRPEKMGSEACRAFGTWAGGDVGVLQVAQTVRTIREGELRSMQVPESGSIGYGDGLASITVPLVAAAGDKDFMKPEYLQLGVLDRVSSEHRRLIAMSGIGHCDMLYHLRLDEIFGWLDEKAAAD